MEPSVDLNKLLSYSLSINFAPLTAHLSSASAAVACRLDAQQAALDSLQALLAAAPPGAGGAELGPLLAKLLALEARVAAGEQKLADLPPPHLFSWDRESPPATPRSPYPRPPRTSLWWSPAP